MSVEAGRGAVWAENLEKRFGDFVAVNRVSFDVAKGEIFGFLGPNGAGTSTTIRMLCGILAPSAGRGAVAGFEIGRQAEQIKANIGYMSQRFSLYEDLTVEENIRVFSGIYGVPRKRWAERQGWVLEVAGLEELRQARTGALPGGGRQRLALGCALLHDPPIVFLDEPTSGVDPIQRRRFWELIHQLAGGGKTIFVTTHYMDEAEYCDRIALIYRGEMIALGAPAHLKKTMVREEVLEVACREPVVAMDRLFGLPGVKEVSLFGGGLHVMVEAASAGVPALREALSDELFEPVQVERILPSMEDLFVSLIEARDRDRGEQREVRV